MAPNGPFIAPKSHQNATQNTRGKRNAALYHTVSHPIITDSNKRILAVEPARDGRKHDQRIYDEARVDKPPDVLVLGDLGYLGTSLEIPQKASRKRPLSKQDKDYNTWHAKLRIGVEPGIGRMKKCRIFADIYRNNGQENMIARNIKALANLNLKPA